MRGSLPTPRAPAMVAGPCGREGGFKVVRTEVAVGPGPTSLTSQPTGKQTDGLRTRGQRPPGAGGEDVDREPGWRELSTPLWSFPGGPGARGEFGGADGTEKGRGVGRPALAGGVWGLPCRRPAGHPASSGRRLLPGHFLSGQRPHDFVPGRAGKKTSICVTGPAVPGAWPRRRPSPALRKSSGADWCCCGGSRCVRALPAPGWAPGASRSPCGLGVGRPRQR